MCHIELSTCFNFIPFPSGLLKHAAVSFWSLACDTVDQLTCASACVCMYLYISCVLSCLHCVSTSLSEIIYLHNYNTKEIAACPAHIHLPHLEWMMDSTHDESHQSKANMKLALVDLLLKHHFIHRQAKARGFIASELFALFSIYKYYRNDYWVNHYISSIFQVSLQDAQVLPGSASPFSLLSEEIIS